MLIASLALAGGAAAHGAKPQHGGVIQSAGDLSFELVARDGKAVIYVDDHGKPLSTRGASGNMTVLTGTKKTELVLTPDGANMLAAATPVRLWRSRVAARQLPRSICRARKRCACASCRNSLSLPA
jgi:hypothetical protein